MARDSVLRWRDLLQASGPLAVRVSSRQQIEHLAASSTLAIGELEVESNMRGENMVCWCKIQHSQPDCCRTVAERHLRHAG